jgi:hypothetical protein
MPKSRRRKNRKTQRITKADTRAILEGQRQRFREKFGRDWGDNDPVFFDQTAGSARRRRSCTRTSAPAA